MSNSGKISPREESEATLIAKIKQLQNENQALAKRERENADLMATVSHEIRTPIGAIVAMVELLESTGLNDTQGNYTRTLALAADNLLTMTDDLLNFAKLNSNQINLDNEIIVLPDLIRTIETAIAPRAAAKSLALHVNIEESCPVSVMADPIRISQIINNLANNALKFTSEGAITINVSASEMRPGRQQIRISIADTGIGISGKERAKIFNPFSQANGAINAEYGGSGLGLWISKKLANLMDGDLDFDSEPGIGSNFWFTIQADEVAEVQTPQQAPAVGCLSGHALIVEDNSLNQMLIQTYLDKFGLTYDVAGNGAEALVAAETKHYDIILMDMMMPVMDGITATKELIKRWGGSCKVPILALTANVLEDQVEACLDAGMSGCVAKPIRAENFFAALSKLLSGQDMCSTGTCRR